MTREEAIVRIKDHKIVHKMNEPKAILISEALDMAIKSLEAWDKVIETIYTNQEHTKGTSEFGQGKIYGLDIAEDIIYKHLREVEE